MNRPVLRPVSEEMRNLCLMLGKEILRWPGVSVRPMFGMLAFYRGYVVFAMLPDKRALENASAFAYKLASRVTKTEGEKWKLFGITDTSELNAALVVLDKAYREAAWPTRA
jgi:hypothetical protein